jgi:hypothetical protein
MRAKLLAAVGLFFLSAGFARATVIITQGEAYVDVGYPAVITPIVGGYATETETATATSIYGYSGTSSFASVINGDSATLTAACAEAGPRLNQSLLYNVATIARFTLAVPSLVTVSGDFAVTGPVSSVTEDVSMSQIQGYFTTVWEVVHLSLADVGPFHATFSLPTGTFQLYENMWNPLSASPWTQSDTVTFTVTPIAAAVPEPAAMAIWSLLALTGVVYRRWRRVKALSASGRAGHASTTARSSGSNGASCPLSAPHSAPL